MTPEGRIKTKVGDFIARHDGRGHVFLKVPPQREGPINLMNLEPEEATALGEELISAAHDVWRRHGHT